MATEHVQQADAISLTATRDQRCQGQAPANDTSSHVYRLGPDDLEEFINLGEEGQRRLTETPGALDEWVAAHAAKYE